MVGHIEEYISLVSVIWYIFTGCISRYLTHGSKWYNELGSEMVRHHVDKEKGNFVGTYYSAVGVATKTYELRGRFNIDGWSLGWVVSFKNEYRNANTTTAWSGQLQLESGPQTPVIFTTWVLTTETDPKNNWNSTHVGFDTFWQSPRPTVATQKGQCSHFEEEA